MKTNTFLLNLFFSFAFSQFSFFSLCNAKEIGSLIFKPKLNDIKNFKSSSNNIGFLENKGQIVNQNHKKNSEVLFLFNGDGINVQLKKRGFSYDLYQMVSNDLKNNINFHRIDVELIGSNLDCEIEKNNRNQLKKIFAKHIEKLKIEMLSKK